MTTSQQAQNTHSSPELQKYVSLIYSQYWPIHPINVYEGPTVTGETVQRSLLFVFLLRMFRVYQEFDLFDAWKSIQLCVLGT